MVFSSVPLYLDPPNWQQHPNQQFQGSSTTNHETQNLIIPPPPIHQPPPPQPHQMVGIGGGGGGAAGGPQIRPNSMAERARLAKIPPPEAPLKCPRCESTNTKFCYFNNYSLSQPRHFCKTCRRYWTRGGALRSVPVGGGCRRNKRSSSKSSAGSTTSSNKSSLSSPVGGGERRQLHMDHLISPTITGIPSGGGAGGGGGMSFMASLQNMAQLGTTMGNLGLTFGGSLNALGSDHHHNHNHNHNHLEYPQVQFPNTFLGGFEMPGSSGGLYTSSFQNDDDHDQMSDLPKSSSTVKMEDDMQGLHLAKQMNGNTNSQFWGTVAAAGSSAATSIWMDLSGINSSNNSTY